MYVTVRSITGTVLCYIVTSSLYLKHVEARTESVLFLSSSHV